MKHRHRYEVTARRNVAAPEYGTEAYYIDEKRELFPFGKGCEYSTGKEAYDAAKAFALIIMVESSEVTVTKMNGLGGIGEFMNRDCSKLFSTPWEQKQ